MIFDRTPFKLLPDGSYLRTYPFHVCTKGTGKVFFRDDEDMRVAHNFIPICAMQSNVIPFIDCELNSHIHAGILAADYNSANRFGVNYKVCLSKYLIDKYGGSGFRGIECRPILLEDNFHLRNTICYVVKNSLDAGFKVEEYKWSGYSALFSNLGDACGRKVSDMKYREKREFFKSSAVPGNVGWMVDNDGLMIPKTYLDWHYCEDAFNNDLSYFQRILGLEDDDRMEQVLAIDPYRKMPYDELMSIAEDKSMKKFSKSMASLSTEQKIPLIKSIYHSTVTTPSQLSRCFKMEMSEVRRILKIK